jgi:hypothetical protein
MSIAFETRQIEETYVEVQVATSGCCNAFLNDTQVEYEVCPCCKAPCNVVLDYMPVQL